MKSLTFHFEKPIKPLNLTCNHIMSISATNIEELHDVRSAIYDCNLWGIVADQENTKNRDYSISALAYSAEFTFPAFNAIKREDLLKIISYGSETTISAGRCPSTLRSLLNNHY